MKLNELRASGRSDREDLFDAVLPQIEGNAADSNTPPLGACLLSKLNQRANKAGNGAGLRRRESSPGHSGATVLAIGTYRERSENFGPSRFLQVNSPLHITTMPCAFISSSNCSAVPGSKRYMRFPSADLRRCLTIPRLS